ncbi:MAG: hypothetical protein PHW92_00685 [Lutibacter sp.]|nr:hypothetical protein [Lutibacter sp.]
MRTNTYKFKNLIVLIVMTFALINCKNEAQNSSNKDDDNNEVSTSSKSNNKSDQRKVPTGIVKVQFDGETVEFTDFDPNMTTDVTYLDNGIQFRINSKNDQSVLVNMYSPKLLKKIPITISQQTYALQGEEGFKVETQSRLEVFIPSNPPNKRDSKVLYEGTVTLSELSENKLVVTFSGTGLPIGDSKTDFFPLEGKIVLENFNVYDFRD